MALELRIRDVGFVGTTMGKRAKSDRRRDRSGGRAADEVSVLEVAYKLDGSETSWLEGLAATAVTLLDQGWGVTASTWYTGSDKIELRAVVAMGGPPGFAVAAANTVRNAAPEIQGLALSAGTPCTTLSASGGAELVPHDPGSEALVRLGIRDCLIVRGGDTAGYHAVLSTYLPNPTRPSRRIVSRWSRVASHLAAGFRVRRALLASEGNPARCDPLTGGEAILTPRGSVEHAEGPAGRARHALAEAAVAVERARSQLRTSDADAALDAWRGLVAGRW